MHIGVCQEDLVTCLNHLPRGHSKWQNWAWIIGLSGLRLVSFPSPYCCAVDTQEVAAVETIQSSCSSEGGSWYLKLPGIKFLGLPRCLEDLAITLRSGWPASFLSPPPTPLSMLCSYWISSYPWNTYHYDPAQAFLKMWPELYLLVKNANSRSLCLTNRTRI